MTTQQTNVTQADEDLAMRLWRVHPSEIVGQGMTRPQWYAREIARYREAITAPDAAQANESMCGGLYPVHGSVTHSRLVECCDFCGLPADYEPARQSAEATAKAEVERLREALERIAGRHGPYSHPFPEAGEGYAAWAVLEARAALSASDAGEGDRG